jgi:hypothetical protein
MAIDTPSNATATVVIPLCKRKAVLHLLGGLVFVGGSIFILSTSNSQSRYSPLLREVIAICCVVFFGFCAIHSAIQVFDTRPGFIIDSEGIIDNSSAISAGRVIWEEITGLQVASTYGQRFIIIEVVDPQKYVARGNYVRRMLNAANTKKSGSPINITSNCLRIRFDELLHLLTEAFENHKRSSQSDG